MEGHFFVPRYSERLRTEVAAYYRERCGVELSPEEAEEYLDSLADLYRCFKESIRQGFVGGEVSPASGGKTSPNPTYLHSWNT